MASPIHGKEAHAELWAGGQPPQDESHGAPHTHELPRTMMQGKSYAKANPMIRSHRSERR